eukprot:CAMPEP_0172663612 /NCGR_PEP_ID=MMETSP1074-20121228/6046_1 /TAXON_ID=2916 /ORGANISM="Ceratium fusus, Strain PA161109" /LENGTH=54 /DNA_ID=CAMNT_0013479639 /DNA_START=189 /DNA_END=350 /DNA_ORIENTATION=-
MYRRVVGLIAECKTIGRVDGKKALEKRHKRLAEGISEGLSVVAFNPTGPEVRTK